VSGIGTGTERAFLRQTRQGGTMIDVAALVSLCRAALAGGSKVIEAYRKNVLSEEEKQLLIAASQAGDFYLLSVAQLPGTWVRAGGKDFLDQTDPALTARFLEAFRSLCERGYIVHEGGAFFMLTGSGFDRARELARRD